MAKNLPILYAKRGGSPAKPPLPLGRYVDRYVSVNGSAAAAAVMSTSSDTMATKANPNNFGSPVDGISPPPSDVG
jgi:hypothetical protein